MLVRIHCGCWLLLLVNPAAWAQDKYDLRLHLRQGQSWSFEQVFDGVQKSHVSVADHPAVDTQQQTRSVRKGWMTVLAVSNGVPTAVQVAFDPSCSTETRQEGIERTIDFPFTGMTVTVKRNADGRITETFDRKTQGEPDPMQRKELEACLAGNEGRPTRSVAVGEQWATDLKLLKLAYQLTDEDKAASSSKLAAITTLNGRRAAEVTTSTSITKHQGEMTLTEETKGSLWLDLETGALVQSSLEGTTTAKGFQSVPGTGGEQVRVLVDNSGKSQVRLTTTPANAGAGDASQAQSAKPANPLGANPLAEPPAAPAASDSWSGMYGDPQMFLELKANGAGGYEGSILFKGRKFPLTGHAEAGQLKGQFQSDAAAFDFIATQDGKTITLSTGGKTYELKKQGANPLGGGS